MKLYTSTAVSIVALRRCLRQLTPIASAPPPTVTIHFRTFTYHAAMLHPLELRVRQMVSSGSLHLSLAHQMLVGMLAADSPRPRISSFNVLLGWATRAGHPEAALSMYARMMAGGGDISPSAHTYGTLINGCSLAGRVDLGVAFMPHVLKRGIPFNNAICGALVGGMCDAGRLAEAVELFRGLLLREEQQQEGCYPDVMAYTALLNCAFRAERPQLGFAVLADMTKRGCEPSTITYNVILNGLCSLGTLRAAAKVLEFMTPDTFTYTSLLDCFCRVGRSEWGLVLLGDMLRRSLRPDEAVAAVLINGLCAEGKTADAINIFVRMPEMECRADVVTYNSLISCLGGMGQVDLSFAVLGGMMKRGQKPDVMTMNSLVNGLCMDNRVAEAVSLAERMAGMGLEPNVVTCNSLVKGICRTMNVQLALKFLDRMVKCGIWSTPNVITYTTIINELCTAGDMDGAMRLLKEMENRGVVPNAVTHRSVVRGYTRLGQWDEAIMYMKRMLTLVPEADRIIVKQASI